MAQKIKFLSGLTVSIILAFSAAVVARDSPPCNFPSIFNFGDSNSDTGVYNPSTKIKRQASDGRLIMDFFTEKMGRPYLQSAIFGQGYSTGANFASGGSTVQQKDGSTFSYLDHQIFLFTEFKARTISTQSKGKINNTLPKPEDFAKSLYTIDIGQNSIASLVCVPYVQEISKLISVIEAGVKTLYNEGARFFWIHNTGPYGCLPGPDYTRKMCTTQERDEFGCLKHDNQVASEFNKQLKDKVIQMRSELKGAIITYVDVYTAKYNLFKNAKNLGLSRSCNRDWTDCSKYILWEGTHYTDAANRLVADSIFNGALSDPPVSVTHAC